jgi:Sulfotransferase domain
MPRPNFFIIGAQKSGSTWLARNLATHPDVFMPRQELHFFDKRHNFERGIGWYESQFDGADGQTSIGEKTPDYLTVDCKEGLEGNFPGAHHRMHRYYPDAKLIVVLRNPVARAISQINHIIRSGRISPLLSADSLLFGDKQHVIDGHNVILKGFYLDQIRAFLELYRRDQFLFLLFEEDVVKRPADCLATTCEFLGVDSGHRFEDLNRRFNEFNRSMLGLTISYYLPAAAPYTWRLDRMLKGTKKVPSQATIARLYELYEAPNRALFEFLGRSTDAWSRPATAT